MFSVGDLLDALPRVEGDGDPFVARGRLDLAPSSSGSQPKFSFNGFGVREADGSRFRFDGVAELTEVGESDWRGSARTETMTEEQRMRAVKQSGRLNEATSALLKMALDTVQQSQTCLGAAFESSSTGSAQKSNQVKRAEAAVGPLPAKSLSQESKKSTAFQSHSSVVQPSRRSQSVESTARTISSTPGKSTSRERNLKSSASGRSQSIESTARTPTSRIESQRTYASQSTQQQSRRSQSGESTARTFSTDAQSMADVPCTSFQSARSLRSLECSTQATDKSRRSQFTESTARTPTSRTDSVRACGRQPSGSSEPRRRSLSESKSSLSAEPGLPQPVLSDVGGSRRESGRKLESVGGRSLSSESVRTAVPSQSVRTERSLSFESIAPEHVQCICAHNLCVRVRLNFSPNLPRPLHMTLGNSPSVQESSRGRSQGTSTEPDQRSPSSTSENDSVFVRDDSRGPVCSTEETLDGRYKRLNKSLAFISALSSLPDNTPLQRQVLPLRPRSNPCSPSSFKTVDESPSSKGRTSNTCKPATVQSPPFEPLRLKPANRAVATPMQLTSAEFAATSTPMGGRASHFSFSPQYASEAPDFPVVYLHESQSSVAESQPSGRPDVTLDQSATDGTGPSGAAIQTECERTRAGRSPHKAYFVGLESIEASIPKSPFSTSSDWTAESLSSKERIGRERVTRFPIIEMKRWLQSVKPTLKCQRRAAVYLSGVMEYLCAELIDLAASVTVEQKQKRIQPNHIALAIGKDEEMRLLLQNVTIGKKSRKINKRRH